MSEEKEIKLLPCPFCGSNVDFSTSGDAYNHKRDWYYIECKNCHVCTKEYTAFEVLLQNWNTRQPDKELVEKNNKLVTRNAHVMGLNKVFAEENRKLKAELDGFNWRQHD